jgi:Na+/phosphate symporter
MGVAWLGLSNGAFSGLRLEGRDLAGLIDLLYGPLLAWTRAHLPRLLLFVVGLAALLGAFRAFDRALPDLSAGGGPRLRPGHVFYRPWFMFAVGLGVTSLTLSVSVSLSLLVPLAAKGYVRRENVCPYILGANVTTFIDTLFAGALVGHPDGVRVVALMMASVTLFSLPVVVGFPYAFGRLVDGIATRATGSRRALVAFVVLLLAVPLALIAM